ncbi:MAG: YafY family transcriptional regulator [Clostridia bacterium]|nr:YafY family transcriptional regulator [Clostridia bacterium]
MKIDRLMGILTYLLQKGKATAPELALRFEVSRRTIQRDVEDLCKAGIPVVTFQGGDGGIAISDGFKLDRSLLSKDELQNILIGLKSLGSVSDTPRIQKLIEKLSPQEAVISLKNNVIIDLASHYKSSISEKIDLFKKAIFENRRVSFDYYSKDGHKLRRIEPGFVIFKWSSWYVYGFCYESQDFRLFKFNRLWHVALLDETFEPREIPEEKASLNDVFADNKKVVLLLDASAEYLIIETYGPHSYERRPDGKILAIVPYTHEDYILSWIYSFGDRVQILEPEELIRKHKNMAKNILSLYERDI